jgi:hypothetical protein
VADDVFSEAQRNTIGVSLKHLGDLVQTLRGLGVHAGELGELERALESLAEDTGARLPAPPPNQVNATLVRMLVLEEELRPRRLAAYGDVDPEGGRILEAHVDELVDLTRALIARLRGANL